MVSSTSIYVTGPGGHEWAAVGQAGHESAGDVIELPDAAETEPLRRVLERVLCGMGVIAA